MNVPEYRAIILREDNLNIQQRLCDVPQAALDWWLQYIVNSPRYTPTNENMPSGRFQLCAHCQTPIWDAPKAP